MLFGVRLNKRPSKQPMLMIRDALALIVTSLYCLVFYSADEETAVHLWVHTWLVCITIISLLDNRIISIHNTDK